MTGVRLESLTAAELSDHLAAWFTRTLPTAEQRRLLVAALRELATGVPVQPERLARLADLSLAETVGLLREASAEWDTDGAHLVGFGLTSRPTQHAFRINGQAMWTWCAADTLIFPVLVGAPASVESPCGATGDPVRLEVTPDAIGRIDPADAVVSIVTPSVRVGEVRAAVCALQNLYRDREAAADWRDAHPDALLMPVADAFAVLRRAILQVWPELRAA